MKFDSAFSKRCRIRVQKQLQTKKENKVQGNNAPSTEQKKTPRWRAIKIP